MTEWLDSVASQCRTNFDQEEKDRECRNDKGWLIDSILQWLIDSSWFQSARKTVFSTLKYHHHTSTSMHKRGYLLKIKYGANFKQRDEDVSGSIAIFPLPNNRNPPRAEAEQAAVKIQCAESHEPQYQAYTHTLCEICYGRPPFCLYPWHLCETWKQDRNRKLLSFVTTCFGTTERMDFAYSGQRQNMIASYQIHPAHAHGKRFNQNAMIL